MRREWLRLLRAFGYAWAGMRFLFRHEPNARIHLLLALIAAALAWWLDFSATEWALLMLAIGMVLAAEAMNTAIEALTDLVAPQFHPQAQMAKDVAAAGVAVTALAAVLMALFIYLPKLVSHLP